MSELESARRFERVEYAVSVGAFSVPDALFVHLPGSSDRDFLFVPSQDTMREFPLFAHFSFSSAVGAKFCYVGGSGTEIQVARADDRGANRTREIRFELVRWAHGSRTPFPDRLLLAQRFFLPTGERSVTEIVPVPTSTDAG